MTNKTFSLFFKLAFILIYRVWSTQAGDCDVSDNQRIDCGWHGIDQTKCQTNNHCCWKPSSSGGNTPWCFYNQSIASALKTATACEHHSPSNLACTTDQQIKIMNVFYGRDTSDKSCHNGGDVSCYNPNAKNIVENMCKCNSTCSVSPSGTIWNFDTTCDQINAQLRVFYICVPKDFAACPTSSQSHFSTMVSHFSEMVSLFSTTNLLPQTPFLSTSMSAQPNSENTIYPTIESSASMEIVSSTQESTLISISEEPTSLLAIESTLSSPSPLSTINEETVMQTSIMQVSTDTVLIQTVTKSSSISSGIIMTSLSDITDQTAIPSSTIQPAVSQSITIILPTQTPSVTTLTSSSSMQYLSSISSTSRTTFSTKMTTTTEAKSSITASPTSSMTASSSVIKKPDGNGGKGKRKLNQTQKILIGVGVGVLVLLLIMILYCRFYRRRRYRQHTILDDEISPVPTMYSRSDIVMDDMPKKSVRDMAVKLHDQPASQDNKAVELDENTFNNDLYGEHLHLGD